MHYILPLRDVIAASVELMVGRHRFDGLVMLCSCDKIVPGMLMAAARLNLPTIFVPGGPMLPGWSPPASHADHPQRRQRGDGPLQGRADQRGGVLRDRVQRLPRARRLRLHGHGQHHELHRRGAGPVPARLRHPARRRRPRGPSCAGPAAGASSSCGGKASAAAISLARQPGERRARLRGHRRLDQRHAAPARPGRGGWARTSRSTPSTGSVGRRRSSPSSRRRRRSPSSTCTRRAAFPPCCDVLAPLLDGDVPTVSGRTIGQIAAQARQLCAGRRAAPAGRAAGAGGRHRGAPRHPGARRRRGQAERRRAGHAAPPRAGARLRVREEDLRDLLANRIRPGDVLVIRNEGPRGGPGMRELSIPAAMLVGMGLGASVAMITDGRYSGARGGPASATSAGSLRRRADRRGARRRPDRDRHPRAASRPAGVAGGLGRTAAPVAAARIALRAGIPGPLRGARGLCGSGRDTSLGGRP